MTATGYENQTLLGDCLDVLRGLPSDTFDSCVTDPPYGLGDEPTVTEIVAYLQGADLKTGDFMGKDWDIPSVPVWCELYRVLKPGAHVLTFGGTRTWDLISLGARAAGFEKRDTIGDIHPGLLWIQGQGMPKSTNVSKQIDKKKGQKPKVIGPDHARRKRANKGTTSEILPSYDKPRAAQAEAVITEPATDEAKQWEGYGTGLKPTWEPIMIFRKPFKGTLAENVLKHGTGAMNIDACRVRHATPEDFEKHKAGVEAIKARGGSMDNSWKNSSDLSGASDVTSAGRWPPNLVLTHRPECQNTGSKKAPATSIHGEATAVRKTGTHAAAKGYLTVGREQPVKGFADADGTETVDAWECAPGCPVAELDAQSGNRRATLAGRADPNESHEHPGIDTTSESMWFGKDRTFLGRVYADEGGASRFYPQFEGQKQVEAPFFYTGKATKKETSLDGEIKNDHPCLHPDTEVLTERGYRAIGTIVPGDKVYSANGRFHTIEAVTRHPYTSPDLFEISVGPHRKALPTDNHPFLVWRPEKKGNSIVGSAVMWLRADQIRRGDYTMTPVLASVGSVPTGLPDDPEFWFLLGLYAAEGHIQRRDGRNDAYPRFSLHCDEQELIDRIRDYFGHEHTSVYPNGENGVQVMAFDSEKGALFERLAGNGAGSKVLAPIIWELPSDLRAQVFYGWLSGDGGDVRDELQGKTVSPDLAVQLQLLGEAAGFRSRVNMSFPPEGAGIGDRKFKSTRTCFQLNFSEGRGNQPNRVTHEGVEYTLRFVTQVRPVPYVGDVVNLSVEGSPTFQTTVGMSHNTKKPLKLMQWLIKLVTPKGGLTIDPYAGSGSTLHAAVEEGVRYTGIEKDPHAHEIASKRLAIVTDRAQDRQGQRDLFDLVMSGELDDGG